MTAPVLPGIDQLQELPLVTPPFSYWPQTWGWLALLLIILLAVAAWTVRRWWRWQRDRYRREALQAFDRLALDLADPQRRLPALRALPTLLKRVAMSITGAPPAATLSGGQWQAFLAQRAAKPLPEQFAARLHTLAYAPDAEVLAIPEDEVWALFAAGRYWIEAHHVAV
ncbi:DUF4381 domain-containing protein [Pseudomonas sp. BJa5]|uniref:DUF4381 domain-containing protein n=1 Tax=Pseudomonas sp. BJa5 TaxID=2936270 RepID=UPI00255958CB|nr:DUF4381 domain-containing protein [Pseudomonas sp. BGr12]MDL2423999.1 DUF4381 domain-containing protein [Pseudomonas sp. BGr12]